MKLLTKYNRLNITATILTFIAGSCAFYFLLNYILIRELDERLQGEQQEIQAYVTEHNALPDIIRTKEQLTLFYPVAAKENTEFVTVENKSDKESEKLREIHFTVLAGSRYYLVKVEAPLDETEALLRIIIGVTIVMIAIILLAGFLINRIVIGRLWKPFYETIKRVKAYHLTDQEALKLEKADIDEFALLNQSINEMVERIQQDYGSLKDFTGQAAHEMQTPLAVIRTKLDALMQQETLLENNAQQITDIERAVHRLSRLHQSLLLLTKVENRQFVLNEKVRIDKIIEDKCSEYSDIAGAVHLSIKLSLQATTVLFHQHLAEILVSNLLNNAIRYNIRDGSIEIVLRDNTLNISNTSANAQLDNTRLFKRFYRNQTALEGSGLGLSIVKQICDVAEYGIAYRHEDGIHRFEINFNARNF